MADLIGDGHTVQAVGSRDLVRARAFADRFGIATAHGGYDELVADPEVDAVYIATPHVFHAEQALLAIAAGKHVVVEKPFTLNAPEAEAIHAAAAAAGVVALDGMWTRYTPQSTRMREIVAEGTIGLPRLVIGTHLQALPTDPAHRLNDPALGGGALLDLGVYPVAFALDLLGEVTGIDATATLSDRGVDRRVGTILDFAGGGQALLHSALDLAAPNTAVLHGTSGRIEFDGPFFSPVGFTVFADTLAGSNGPGDGDVVERYEADENGLRGMHHMARAVEALVAAGTTEDPRFTAAQSIAVMRVLDEIRRLVGVTYPGEASPGIPIS